MIGASTSDSIKINDAYFHWGFATKEDKELDKEKEAIKNKYAKVKEEVKEEIKENHIEDFITLKGINL